MAENTRGGIIKAAPKDNTPRTVIAFTGQRPKNLYGYDSNEGYDQIKDAITKVLTEKIKGPVEIRTGGAQGADMLAFAAADELKKEGFDIRNTLYLPYPEQPDVWLEEGIFGQEAWRNNIEKADEARYVYDKRDEANGSRQLMDRNDAMLNGAEILIAVAKTKSTLSGISGGTGQAIKTATKDKHIPLTLIRCDGEPGAMTIDVEEYMDGKILSKNGKAVENIKSAKPIKEFRGAYNFLSNFFPGVPFVWDNRRYNSAEAAFQSAKTTDPATRDAISRMDANNARSLGRNLKVRDNWEDIKLETMKSILHAKFLQNPELRDKLAATKNAQLIEGNTWGDTYWGVDAKTGKGENHLGKLLMELREEIVKQMAAQPDHQLEQAAPRPRQNQNQTPKNQAPKPVEATPAPRAQNQQPPQKPGQPQQVQPKQAPKQETPNQQAPRQQVPGQQQPQQRYGRPAQPAPQRQAPVQQRQAPVRQAPAVASAPALTGEREKFPGIVNFVSISGPNELKGFMDKSKSYDLILNINKNLETADNRLTTVTPLLPSEDTQKKYNSIANDAVTFTGIGNSPFGDFDENVTFAEATSEYLEKLATRRPERANDRGINTVEADAQDWLAIIRTAAAKEKQIAILTPKTLGGGNLGTNDPTMVLAGILDDANVNVLINGKPVNHDDVHIYAAAYAAGYGRPAFITMYGPSACQPKITKEETKTRGDRAEEKLGHVEAGENVPQADEKGIV